MRGKKLALNKGKSVKIQEPLNGGELEEVLVNELRSFGLLVPCGEFEMPGHDIPYIDLGLRHGC